MRKIRRRSNGSRKNNYKSKFKYKAMTPSQLITNFCTSISSAYITTKCTKLKLRAKSSQE
jgi:hypothetical protein